MDLLVKNIAECFAPLFGCIKRDPLGCRQARSVPTLPQAVAEWQQRQRQRQLRTRQDQYRYNYTYIPGLAMVDRVPLREYPGIDWFALALGQISKVVHNLMALIDRAPAGLAKLDAKVSLAQVSGTGPKEGAKPQESADAEKDTTTEKEQFRRLQIRLTTLDTATGLARHAQGPFVVADTETSVRGAPGTAVFSKHSNLLCREMLELNVCPSCGSLLPRCDDLVRDIAEITARLTSPCTDCAKFALDILWQQCLHLAEDVLTSVLEQHHLFGRPRDIEGYNSLFHDSKNTIPLPKLGKKAPDGRYLFEDDRTFALRQVAGQNPMMLTLIRAGEDFERFEKKMPITDQQYQSVMGDQDSLRKACEQKRLFLVDYGFAKTVARGSDEPKFAGQKYIGAPIGLFALPKASKSKPKHPNSKEIVAVAIQCQQEPGPKNPIFTPEDADKNNYKWAIAKTVFNNAAGNNSEFIQHLGYAHLLAEAFGIAMVRTLPDEHPLNVLLTPHLEATMFANNMAQSGMNKPPDMNLIAAEISATIGDALAWTSDAVRGVDVNDWLLPKQFKRQGTDDPEVLPHYPYRDDSLRIWDAICAWITAYLDIYYPTDNDVVQDYELANWVGECERAARLSGIGDNGRIKTREQLIDTVTLIVYQASAHHALTNFPLSKIELYAPALPLAIYRPPPTDKRKAKRQDWLDYYPPLSIAMIQQSLYFIIGTLHYTQLGEYPVGWFVDRRVDKPLREFKDRLREIEGEILRENANVEMRPMPYIYLLPSRIPQSTNI